MLRAQLAEAKAADVLVPQVVYGYFAANAEGNELVIWKDESRSSEWMRFTLPPPAQGAVAVHHRLLPPGRLRRRGLRRLPHRDHGPAGRRGGGPAVRREPVHRSTCSPTAWASRWPRPWPSTGTAASARSGASPARTARPWPGCSASSTGAAATRGATRPARTWRTTRRWPSCSAPDRIGVEVSEGVPVPPRADDLGHHLPPPPGQVLRRVASGSFRSENAWLAVAAHGPRWWTLAYFTTPSGLLVAARRSRTPWSPSSAASCGARSQRVSWCENRALWMRESNQDDDR